MTTYKYLSEDVVAVVDEDGTSRMSGLASVLVPEGCHIEPADPIQAPPPVDPIGKLAAFLAANPDVAALLG